MLIKYIKSILWKVVKRLSYIEEARCLKVNQTDTLNGLCHFAVVKHYSDIYLGLERSNEPGKLPQSLRNKSGARMA